MGPEGGKVKLKALYAHEMLNWYYMKRKVARKDIK